MKVSIKFFVVGIAALAVGTANSGAAGDEPRGCLADPPPVVGQA